MRVCDFIADFIYSSLGVKHVFMLTGAGIMHLTDGVASHNKLEAICPHHEQTSSMAIDAYSRATENFGVGYFTTGPGSTNAITGLGGAWQDSVPCMFISGQVKRSEASSLTKIDGLRQFGVQELDVIPIVNSLCKYAVTINDASRIKYELEKAHYIAKSGRPGPVWIEIPLDIQASQIEPERLESFIIPKQSIPKINNNQTSKIIELLKNSKRPVIISGQGIRISKAINTLNDFISKYHIPVVTPYLGIDTISYDNPFYVGKSGVKGDRAANFAMQNSDLIIAIGTSLHVSVIGYTYEHFARAAKKIVIDIDKTSHKKETINIELLVQSDAKAAIQKLIEYADSETITKFSEWANQCRKWKEDYPVCLPSYQNLRDSVSSYVFIDTLSQMASENDVFISDAGGTFYSISQGIKLTKSGQRYIPSSAMATMGFSLPAAIGSSVALDQRILAITGDGSFQQNIQELQTLVEYNLPVKLFILDNGGYESIRTSQKNYFNNRFIGEGPKSGVSFPDTIKIAEAYGLKTFQIKDHSELQDTIDKILNFSGPVICNVLISKNQEIIPTVSSRVNPDGTMSSQPLEDMYPFLERDEYLSNLFIDDV